MTDSGCGCPCNKYDFEISMTASSNNTRNYTNNNSSNDNSNNFNSIFTLTEYPKWMFPSTKGSSENSATVSIIIPYFVSHCYGYLYHRYGMMNGMKQKTPRRQVPVPHLLLPFPSKNQIPCYSYHTSQITLCTVFCMNLTN